MNAGVFEVRILGSSAALPAYGRLPSSQLVNIHEQLFLVDCGEGTQFQLSKYAIRRTRIQHIFISHLHGDHVFGLPGLLTSYNLMDRKDDLHLYGPEGLESMMRHVLSFSSGPLQYDLHFHEIGDFQGKVLYENEHLRVKSLPLKHKIATSGYLFEEKPLKKKLDMDKVRKLGIPVEAYKRIEEGLDLILGDGTVFQNEELTLPDKPVRRYAYCSDTQYEKALIPFIKGVSLLYHETTYLDELRHKARDHGHSTALEAAKLAKEADVNTLLTGHYSSRYEDLGPIEAECKSIFGNTIIGTEGLLVSVPQGGREV